MAALLSIGSCWLTLVGLLWLLPTGAYRRGWAYESFGVFEAVVRVTPYRHSGRVAFEAGDGLGVSMVLTLVATVVAVLAYRTVERYWRVLGRCSKCGYQLYRGLYEMELGACPDCGNRIQT